MVVGCYSNDKWKSNVKASYFCGNISAVIIVPGSNEIYKPVPVLEWPVHVEVNYRYKMTTFLSSNWQWLVSFVFGTLFGTRIARSKKQVD